MVTTTDSPVFVGNDPLMLSFVRERDEASAAMAVPLTIWTEPQSAR